MTDGGEALIFCHGGGWQGWLLSSPLFVSTLIILVFFVPPAVSGEFPGNPLPILLTLAGLFAFVGITILSLRWYKRISVSDGHVISWFTVLGIGRKRVIPLSHFTKISVPSRTLHSRNGAEYHRYHVWIAGPKAKVYLTEFSDPAQAKEVADRIAETTGLAIEQPCSR